MSDVDIDDIISVFNNIRLSDSLNSSNNISTETNRSEVSNTMAFQEFYLKMIPEFDGEPASVGNFLKSCDLIMNSFYDAENPNLYLNHFLLNFVQSKLTGNARLIISTKIINTWLDLRTAIVQNFTDQRDETSLLSELLSFKQKPQEDALTFSNRCRYIEQLLISNLICNEDNAELRNLKAQIYTQQTLKAFLGGLRNPLGLAVRSRSPNTIEDALRFIIDEENYQYRDRNFLTRPQPSQNNQHIRRNIQTHTSSHTNSPQQTFPIVQFQRQNFQPRSNSHMNYRSFPNRSEIPRNPHPRFQQTRPNNNFVPEPMDTSSGNSRMPRSQISHQRPQSNYFRQQPNSTNNVKVEELFNHESNESPEIYDAQIENFLERAPKNPQT